MAHYQNGQRPSGQYSNVQGLPTSPSTSGLYGGSTPARTTQAHEIRRAPSFDPGDDVRFGDEGYGYREDSARDGGRYRTEGNASTQDEELFMATQSAPSPPLSYASSPGGYQHQSGTSRPATQSAYNPQQYSRSESQNNRMAVYGGASSSYTAAPQPYNPAAYQHPTFSGQSSYGSPTYGSLPTGYGAQSPYTASGQSPPLPPRPYGSQRVSHYGGPPPQTPNLHSEGYYGRPPLPPLPASAPVSARPVAYSPPAPPPPPFSPNRDAFSSSSMSQPGRPYSQNLGMHSFQQTSNLKSGVYSQHYDWNSTLDDQASEGPSTSSPYEARPLPSPGASPISSANSTPGPPPPQHSPQRMNTTGRHPQARPLPGPPATSEADPDYFTSSNGGRATYSRTDAETGYDELMREVEDAVTVMGNASGPSTRRRSPRAERGSHQSSLEEEEKEQEPQPLFKMGSRTGVNPDASHSHTNGHLGVGGPGHYVNYGAYSDGSDAEAAAGLAAMQMAEEEDQAAAQRRSGSGTAFGTHDTPPHSFRSGSHEELSSDSDIVGGDLDLYGGGYGGRLHYGDGPLPLSIAQARMSEANSAQGSGRSSEGLGGQGDMYDYMPPEDFSIHPFPTLGARVDTGGTGGLSEPGFHSRRLSFDDGDEATLADSETGRTSGSQSPVRDYRARPLPPAPVGSGRVPLLWPAGTYQHPERQQPYTSYPTAPYNYDQLLSPDQLFTPLGTPVPRSTSLISHSSTPQTVPPIRSKTDAEERRTRLLKQHPLAGIRSASTYGSDFGSDASALPPSGITLDLPEIPLGKRKKYNPAKMSTSDFKKCTEPWALSSIVAWVKDMSEGESDLREHSIVDGIVALFTHKVPTMNTADAETLGALVVNAMLKSGTLIKEEEWVKFTSVPLYGVLFQLTGTGCYAPRVHSQPTPMTGRCYAHHCMRTLKKINLQTQLLEPQQKVEDWATFYKVKKEDTTNVDKKEIERQNILHEIVTTEDSYMEQLNILQVLYRDELSRCQPPIISPKRIETFLTDVFGKVDAIKRINEDYLLAQLKYRQQEQGPWIVGFSDIFREWVRKARNAYIEYAASFPHATFLVRQECERNILFQQFLNQMRDNERSKRLGWDTYLKAPITRLQRYTLMLSTVQKNMVQETEEKSNLQAAIEEIKSVTIECDTRVAEMSKKVDLSELNAKLKLRPGMEKKVELNLTHLGREVIFQGDLQRAGGTRFSWRETRAILFDHYLVLAKTTSQRDAAGGLKYEQYDVSKMPIPMDLLVLESADDDPVVKNKTIGTVSTISSKAHTAQNPQISRTSSSQTTASFGPGSLHHANTTSSLASVSTTSSKQNLMTATVIDQDERIMYPFRIKHLGQSAYTLYAPTAQNRQDWHDKIVEAKTRHAASLFAQNAEPFRLRVMADTAFAYDAMWRSQKSIVIRGTPLDRAIREVEHTLKAAGPKPRPVCRASVNCATSFNQPYPGKQMVAVGTDFGVFISEYNNPRGWSRAIPTKLVSQIAVLEEFSLMLIIADKSFIAYHLDSVCSPQGPVAAASEPSRRAPQKLSGARDVGFFATGRMKDRTLVFYKKRDGISSTFKVLEPVYLKSSTFTTRGFSSRFLNGVKKGTTEFFRDFDDFYIPTDTFAINLFHSSLAIATTKGIEVLTLDKKVPFSIPDLKPPHCASIASRIREQKPLGMFRLNESEFLIVFEEVGVYVNKHGDVSRGVVMEFVGRAKQAVLSGGMYLVLVDVNGGFVEVRNAVNGRLRQVISGRDVRLLDDGGEKGNVKICMQHPEAERCQIIVEMVVNEGLKE